MAGPILDVQIKDTMPTDQLLTNYHVKFLTKMSQKHDETLDFLRLSGSYWVLTALDVAEGNLNRLKEEEVIEFVLSCHDKQSGGFVPNPNHDPHLLSTLSGVQILALYDRLDLLDVEAVVQFVKVLQQPDGSFWGDCWGEVDTRFSFCAVATLQLLHRLDAIDTESATNFVLACRNFDGGFGTRPGSESHAGQIYCCLGTLSILGALRRLDADQTAWWLAERQMPSGGLNGRPEKAPDVCYSWWVLSSLKILGRLSWISTRAITTYILACQDDETGGFSDRPGHMPDPFHTLFGLAGLSLLYREEPTVQDSIKTKENGNNRAPGDVARDGSTPDNDVGSDITPSTVSDSSDTKKVDDAKEKEERLQSAFSRLKCINPVFCLPEYVVQRMNISVQLI